MIDHRTALLAVRELPSAWTADHLTTGARKVVLPNHKSSSAAILESMRVPELDLIM